MPAASRPWTRAENARAHIFHKALYSEVDNGLSISVVPQRLNRIQLCGARRRITARNQADKNREAYRAADQPERQRKEIPRRASLLLDVDVRAEVDDSADGPAESQS